jgi:hypothetical protein
LLVAGDLAELHGASAPRGNQKNKNKRIFILYLNFFLVAGDLPNLPDAACAQEENQKKLFLFLFLLFYFYYLF